MTNATTRTVQWTPNKGQWNAFDWETGMRTHEGIAALLRTPNGARMQLELAQSVLKVAVEGSANRLFAREVLANLDRISAHHLQQAQLAEARSKIKAKRAQANQRKKTWLVGRSSRRREQLADKHRQMAANRKHHQDQREYANELLIEDLPLLRTSPTATQPTPDMGRMHSVLATHEAAYLAEVVGFEAALAAMVLVILGVQWRLARPQLERLHRTLTRVREEQSPQQRLRADQRRSQPPPPGNQAGDPPPYVYSLSEDPTMPPEAVPGAPLEEDPMEMGPEAYRNLSRMADNPQLMRMVADFEMRRVPMAERVVATRQELYPSTQSALDRQLEDQDPRNIPANRPQPSFSPRLFAQRPPPRIGIGRRESFPEEQHRPSAAPAPRP